MADTNEYLKRYNETKNDLVKPTNLGSGDDYYKLARDQEYGLMFDKEVALENAKANAMKYTQNQINAQGFGGTGYGSSLQSGIYNTYLNKANEAKNDYAENIRNINLQEQQAMQDQANDRFQSVTTMLQGADTTENMNQLLTDYGYGSVDKDGNFVWNAEKPEGMSDDDWYQMQYYYRMKANDFAQQSEGQGALGSYEALSNYLATLSGTTDTSGAPTQTFGAEAQTLWAYGSSGQITNGGVVAVTNGQGQTVYLKWTQYGFVKSDQNEYNGADHQYTLKRVDNGKPKDNYNEWKQVK